MSKRLLADVLWDAANEHLWDGVVDRWSWDAPDCDEYTCCAVAAASGVDIPTREWRFVQKLPALLFIKSLGCKTGAANAFKQHEPGPDRQGVRYMWLLLAMHVAEDEGITV